MSRIVQITAFICLVYLSGASCVLAADTPSTVTIHDDMAVPDETLQTGSTDDLPDTTTPGLQDTTAEAPLLEVVDDSALTSDSSATPLSLDILDTFQQSRPEWSISIGKVFWAIVVFFLGYITIRWITGFLEALAERRSRARLTIKAIIPVIRIFGWTSILVFIITRIFAPPLETLVAFTASAGIAIGFASQDVLKNIFGGIMILFDRPFQVGDKIQVGDHYGEVVHIGLRTVRIVTPDDSLVSIPNGEVANQAISNSNAGEPNCQVAAEFYLPVGIDVKEVRSLAYKTALISPYVYLNKPVAVVVKNEIYEGRSMLKVRLKAYVHDIRNEFAFQSNLTQVFLEELLERKLITPEDFDP